MWRRVAPLEKIRIQVCFCDSSVDYEFANGCRAPPWRQVHGDISYILVKPSDSDRLSITAGTSGYFENKGKTDENEIDYERNGDVFPSLVALLKEKSQHFAKTISKKVRKNIYTRQKLSSHSELIKKD